MLKKLWLYNSLMLLVCGGSAAAMYLLSGGNIQRTTHGVFVVSMITLLIIGIIAGITRISDLIKAPLFRNHYADIGITMYAAIVASITTFIAVITHGDMVLIIGINIFLGLFIAYTIFNVARKKERESFIPLFLTALPGSGTLIGGFILLWRQVHKTGTKQKSWPQTP